jgi:methionyl-tRNA synthetase
MNVQGSKFSKSRNWAIWLPDILDRYDPDAIRYCVAAMLPETSDSEFTWEDFVARNNNELVAWWGNLANRVLKFADRNWGGIVPGPGDLRPADRELLAKVESGFEAVGRLLAEVKLRRALSEAMSLAREVNVYLDGAPWFGVINEDKQAAATTVYTALQAINYLKVLLSPFLPFTAQQLHEMLGFEGQLFGEQRVEAYHEEAHAHEALTYDGSKAIGRWEPQRLPPGQRLRQPLALFKKLDEKVIVEEIARLGA